MERWLFPGVPGCVWEGEKFLSSCNGASRQSYLILKEMWLEHSSGSRYGMSRRLIYDYNSKAM